MTCHRDWKSWRKLLSFTTITTGSQEKGICVFFVGFEFLKNVLPCGPSFNAWRWAKHGIWGKMT
jgi:hypothetical protein